MQEAKELSLNFTLATLKDVDAILSLVHQLEHFISKEQLLNNLNNTLSNPDYCLLVAKECELVIGFLELHFTHFIHDEKERARITSFCIDEHYRNRNIGAAFLEFIEKFCIERNVFRIELTSNVCREDAHRFYEKYNYIYTSKRFYKELLCN